MAVDRSQVSGKPGEIKSILFFLRPVTCHLRPGTYFIRAANSPNSGNSKRSPCHALSERTNHRKSIASEKNSKQKKNHGGSYIRKERAAMVKTKKNPQSKMLCQA